jgi:hypothetical protein
MDTAISIVELHPFWIWLAIAAILLAVEIVTGSGWMLWPAASAALVAVAGAFLNLTGAAETALFAICTIVTTYLGRRYLRRTGPVGPDVNDTATRLIGHRGVASAPFEGSDGRVFIDGKEWSAELEGPGPIPAGAKIEVVAVVGGARLKVRAEA